jgi:hypothetical protein
MDNQHRKIKGYRELTQEEIDLMNKVKEKAEEVGQLVREIQGYHSDTGSHAIDIRWVSIAQTDLQKGFMALTRSIAAPDFF